MEAIVAKFREDMGASTRRLKASPLNRSHDGVGDVRDMIRRGDGVTQIRGQSRKVKPGDDESGSEDEDAPIPRARPKPSITTTNETPSQGGFDTRLQYLHTIWEGMVSIYGRTLSTVIHYRLLTKWKYRRNGQRQYTSSVPWTSRTTFNHINTSFKARRCASMQRKRTSVD